MGQKWLSSQGPVHTFISQICANVTFCVNVTHFKISWPVGSDRAAMVVSAMWDLIHGRDKKVKLELWTIGENRRQRCERSRSLDINTLLVRSSAVCIIQCWVLVCTCTVAGYRRNYLPMGRGQASGVHFILHSKLVWVFG